MTDKRLHEMVTTAGGHEVWSIAEYLMNHWPREMVGLLKVYDGHMIPLLGWITGFAYCLSLIEDNGIPIDLDKALHGYEGEEPYRLQEELERYIAENPYGY